MKAKAMIATIRIVLTVILLFLAYQETGIWTTLILFLLVASNELSQYTLKNHNDSLDALVCGIETIAKKGIGK